MRLAVKMAVLSAGIVTMLGGCEANQIYLGAKDSRRRQRGGR